MQLFNKPQNTDAPVNQLLKQSAMNVDSPMTAELDKYPDYKHRWCEMAEVTATPTLVLNGYRLPNLYQLPDLKYMLQ